MKKIFNFLEKLFTRKDGKQDYCSSSPDLVLGVDIGDCCALHDKNYITGIVSREQADVQLREDIKTRFAEANKPIRGFIVSWVYYFGVRIFGSSRWSN